MSIKISSMVLVYGLLIELKKNLTKIAVKFVALFVNLSTLSIKDNYDNETRFCNLS